MAAALQIWSPIFSKAFDALPPAVREMLQSKIDEMGTCLETYPHKRLQGRPEFKPRAGDYRLLYEFRWETWPDLPPLCWELEGRLQTKLN